MNRQSDAEGENANHGQSNEEEFEAEARGALASRRMKEGEPRAKACGKDEPHSSSMVPSFCLLSERGLRMSAEMKGGL